MPPFLAVANVRDCGDDGANCRAYPCGHSDHCDYRHCLPLLAVRYSPNRDAVEVATACYPCFYACFAYVYRNV